MIKKLQFLRTVDTKNVLNEIHKNVLIQNGLMQISDGKMTVTAINCELLNSFNVSVNADKFLKAMLLAGEEAIISATEKNVMIKHATKGLRVRLGIDDTLSFPQKELPNATKLHSCTDLLESLQLLSPFIGEAGKTALWSCGILFKGHNMYATNNIVLIRHQHSIRDFDTTFILPSFVVNTLLKIGEEPQAVFADDKHAWFLYSNDCWLQTVLINNEWPESVDDTLDKYHNKNIDIIKNNDIIHEDIKALIPFCEDSATQTIILSEDKISTKEGTTLAELHGTNYAIGNAAFKARPLIEVLKIATHADFSSSHVPFLGNNFQGLLMGLRA